MSEAHANASPLPLSVAIVCKDNERTIARTLQSVRGLAVHVVALDSGSTDGTIELLREHGAEVVPVRWAGHVRTKQMALDRCTNPWAMHLDSDESLTEELRASIRNALTRDDASVAGYEVNRKVWWAGRPLNHAWQPEWRLRLVRNAPGSCAAAWGGRDPHDTLLPRDASAPGARIERLRGDLRHDAFDSFADYLHKQVALSRISAESLHADGARSGPLNLAVAPVAAWCKQLLIKHAWRDGWRGWCAASGVAAAALMKHAMLIERARRDD